MSSSTPAGAESQHSATHLRLFGMAFLILIAVVILLCWALFAVIGLTFGLLWTLLVAGLVGWAADQVIPGRLPGGWVGAVIAGLLGGFIGRMLFHALGIQGLALGIDLIPSFVGALLVVGAAELVTSSRRELPGS
jgi:uncharacterized membrane protein YeaQ/YmgE (transglycosylase-associated protein family)